SPFLNSVIVCDSFLVDVGVAPRRRSLRPLPPCAECVVDQERGAIVTERLPDGLGVGPVDLQPAAASVRPDPADQDPPEPLRVERLHGPLAPVRDPPPAGA